MESILNYPDRLHYISGLEAKKVVFIAATLQYIF